MKDNAQTPMSETEEKIIEAAIRCFVRYGARKTSMNDIAKDAGVSRQTLYDLFGGKDELIKASIRSITDKNLAEVRLRLDTCTNLSDRIDAYLAETVVKSFELLQTAGDAEDLITGHNQAGKAEILRSHERHEKLITELLQPHTAEIEAKGLTVRQQAHFIVTVIMGLKYSASSREDLNDLLKTLKVNCLTLIEG